ncbi:MAG: peptide ABC transporter substrate-binding protein [Chloroflexi bacterium]|nr:peptide ABC transporter substrate-binding protein [Chloroflexota bacterium]
MPRRIREGMMCALVAALLLVACRPSPTPPPSAIPTAAATPTNPAPSPTPTPENRSLVICLGQEPLSLYLYGAASQAMWTILEAVYDGPIDYRSYASQAVILTKIPSLADGDALIQSIDVNTGDEVVDANGDLVTLAQGVKIHPAGCTGSDCAVPYDGKSTVKMDQMVVKFSLLPGLTWSDGAPLQASDSVYSYKLASDPNTPVSKYTIDRTSSYQALDTQTVEWVGKPGFLDSGYAGNFWSPLPEHAWGQFAAADLLTNPAATQTPLGWGPYVIDQWVKGDHIQLHKNPSYFRAKEGLPKFDTLVFRFLGENSSASVTALLDGECDVVDQTAGLDEQLSTLADLQQTKKVQEVAAPGPVWDHLDFGIQPASYDDGYNPVAGDRPDLFADVRTRQAFAYCLDRQSITDQLFLGQTTIPDSYLPPQNPLVDKQAAHYGFDPAKGAQLLNEVGWKDADNNPATPRVAQGVANVPDGTPLTVTYQTTQAALREKAGKMVVSSLAQCGIQATLQTINPGDLFAPGPDGPLFGRHFDLAQFSWQAGTQPPCFLYTTSSIPNAANHWVGANITGYSNPEMDTACQSALQALPGQDGYSDAQMKPQEIFARDLPVIPLYQDLKVAAARPDFCGFTMDPTARSELWNLEAFDYGSECK